ncbi:uncharacterized protein LOC130452215 [Diorhabda sublineata]|uniref:uncharacterized protein LOC130452215 n=1 Tax=Diorhabda sublineata TaxID=1163346 RepID=UPI0024E0C75A|nr:uncharacterized protein LOC130452215 [Diorhabda sublineata]
MEPKNSKNKEKTTELSKIIIQQKADYEALGQQVKSLEEKMKNLEDTIYDKDRRIEYLMIENKTLDDENDTLVEELRKKLTEIDELKTQIAPIEDCPMEGDFTEIPTKIGKPGPKATGMEPKNSKNKEKTTELSKIIIQQKADYEALGQQVKSLEEKMKNLEDTIYDKDRRIEYLMIENKTLDDENDTLVEELRKKLTEIDELKTQIAPIEDCPMEGDFTEQMRKRRKAEPIRITYVDIKEMDISAVNWGVTGAVSVDEYQTKIGKPGPRATGMEPKNSKNKEKTTELSRIIIQQKADYEALVEKMGQQIKSLEERMRNYEQTLIAKDKQIKSLEDIIKENNADNYKLADTIVELRDEIKTHEKKIQERNFRYQTKIGKPGPRATGMEPKNSKNKEKTTELSRIIIQQKADYEALVEKMGQQIKSLEERMRNYEQTLIAKDKQIKSLEDIIKENNADNYKLADTIVELRDEIKTHEKKIQERTQIEDCPMEGDFTEQMRKRRRAEPIRITYVDIKEMDISAVNWVIQ